MYFRKLIVGPLQTNCYILACKKSKEAIVIDPGGEKEVEIIINDLKENNLNLRYIINTHGHIDHILGNKLLKESTQASLLIHQLDADSLLQEINEKFSIFLGKEVSSPSPDRFLVDGEEINLGSLKLKVIHTPGHTPGGISLLVKEVIFTGDSLFAGGIGRTDLPGGSYFDLLNSIKERLLVLDDAITIYPGHGPASTIGWERKNNPFLK